MATVDESEEILRPVFTKYCMEAGMVKKGMNGKNFFKLFKDLKLVDKKLT
jgi:hypothetical protein